MRTFFFFTLSFSPPFFPLCSFLKKKKKEREDRRGAILIKNEILFGGIGLCVVSCLGGARLCNVVLFCALLLSPFCPIFLVEVDMRLWIGLSVQGTKTLSRKD